MLAAPQLEIPKAVAQREVDEELIAMRAVASSKRPETLDICVIQYVDIPDVQITADNAAKEIGYEANKVFGEEGIIVGVYAEGNRQAFEEEVRSAINDFNQNIDTIDTEMTIHAYPEVVDFARDLVDKEIDKQYRNRVRIVSTIVSTLLPINQVGFIDLDIGVHSAARFERKVERGLETQADLDEIIDNNVMLLRLLVVNPEAINPEMLMKIYYQLEPLICKGINQTITEWRARQKALMRSL